MRIIAGSKRGRPICAPKGRDTRPTLDRVRESLFAILQFEIPGRRVLDLFAGSGALGLEALSRGAAFAYFCDKDRMAQAALRNNIQTLDFEKQAKIYPCAFESALRLMEQERERVDLVFLDPPYGAGLYEKAFCALLESNLLAGDAILVAEHPPKEPPTVPPGLMVYDSRIYGQVGLTFIRGGMKE